MALNLEHVHKNYECDENMYVCLYDSLALKIVLVKH